MLDLRPLNPFGRLTAIKPLYKRGSNWVWLCRCTCGNECEVKSNLLRQRTTKSCGCLRREHAKKLSLRNRRHLDKIPELTRLRRLGFTYRTLGRMFKIAPYQCHRLINRGWEK